MGGGGSVCQQKAAERKPLYSALGESCSESSEE